MTVSNKQTEDSNLAQASNFLNCLLANEFMIALKTRNAFWNLNGPHFISLYLVFQNHHKVLEEQMNDLANRIQSLGFSVHGGLDDMRNESQIQTNNLEREETMIASLVSDHKKVCELISSHLKDFALQDVSTNDTLIFIQARHLGMIRELREQTSRPVK
jgi:starvation-inducible DNA-binding protein